MRKGGWPDPEKKISPQGAKKGTRENKQEGGFKSDKPLCQSRGRNISGKEKL